MLVNLASEARGCRLVRYLKPGNPKRWVTFAQFAIPTFAESTGLYRVLPCKGTACRAPTGSIGMFRSARRTAPGMVSRTTRPLLPAFSLFGKLRVCDGGRRRLRSIVRAFRCRYLYPFTGSRGIKRIRKDGLRSLCSLTQSLLMPLP